MVFDNMIIKNENYSAALFFATWLMCIFLAGYLSECHDMNIVAFVLIFLSAPISGAVYMALWVVVKRIKMHDNGKKQIYSKTKRFYNGL